MEAPTQSMNLSVGGEYDLYENEASGMSGGALMAPANTSIKEHCGEYSWGQWLGCTVANFTGRYGPTILWTALIVSAVWMIVMFLGIIAEAEVVEANASVLGAAAAYASATYHQKCKNRGGCSKTCPYISEDDPRVVICKQESSIDMLYGQTKQAIKDDKKLVEDSLFKAPEVSVDVGVGTGPSKDTLSTEYNKYINTQVAANREIGNILSKVQDLDKMYGNVDTITIDLIDAKNKAVSFGAAAVVQKNILVISSLNLNAQIMNKYVKEVSAEKQKKIPNFDAEATPCYNSANTINKFYEDASTAVITGSTYDLAIGALSVPNATSQDIIGAMATLLSHAQKSEADLGTTISKFSTVSDLYHKSKNVVESFSNDLPGKMDANKMTEMIQDGDYESAIIKTALEPDLVANHKKFAKDRLSFDSGGGVPSVRDDDNDVVPWVGIFGRPTYRRTDGASAETGTQPLQSIPSDNPNNLMRKSTLRLGTQQFA